LDISQIREKPAERLPVKTFLIPESKRADAYRFIDERIEAGEQVFVICPLIQTGDESDISEKKTIMSEFENLKKTILGKRRIAFLHGQMKSNEKEEIIAKMLRGEIDILVSTSVIEVGIDIKKATVMIIEDADRFGLSQLHQFRGRIGRSNLQSYCFCFTSAFTPKNKGYRKISRETQLPQGVTSENSFKHSKKLKAETDQRTRERLKAFVQNSDGFALAELDLKLRGPGALLGEEQSGFKGINPLWFENTQILADASNAAKDLISKLDENLILKNKVSSYLEVEHLE
jgi:ATP-dependent DNA helicase RecG